MANDKEHFKIILKEVKRHLEDTETSKLAHWDAAATYEKRHKLYIGLPATILSILLTWLISTEFKQSGISENTGIVGYVSVLLGLIVSVLSGLGTFLNFNDLAIKHRTAAENYHSLWRDCKNWQTDFPDESKIGQSLQIVQQYRKRLNEINRDSPQIPKWAWKSVDKQRKEGSTRYKIDQIKDKNTNLTTTEDN